jgi:SAM-dependent methyltransferase
LLDKPCGVGFAPFVILAPLTDREEDLRLQLGNANFLADLLAVPLTRKGPGMAVSEDLYGSSFQEGHSSGSSRSATRVVPLVKELVEPTSVLDVGCGVGTWLAAWIEVGVSDVVGIDGDYVDRDTLKIPSNKYLAYNLEEPLDLGRRFDLVMSLEVAEHLRPHVARSFVESLVRHGDTILFSAAIPGQGGTGHVNEQWPSYWADLFAEHDYQPINALRGALWDVHDVEPWYRQNCLLFVNGTIRETLANQWPLNSLNVVHPEIFIGIATKSIRKQMEERLRASPIVVPVRRIKRLIRD